MESSRPAPASLPFLTFLGRPFTLDLRALALLRAAVAGVVLLDLGIRSTDLEAHYSNQGVLPVAALYDHLWTPYQFSLHAATGLWQLQALLFGLAAGCAVALLLGYHTRLATLLSWILLVSVQNRNPMIGQGGDDLLRMLLFWGLFLPWGRVWSRDARQRGPVLSYAYCSAATVAYVVQLALLYWCTALLKFGPEWTQQGTALYYALSLDQLVLPLGKVLYPYPALLRILTLGTWYGELLVPFLLFLPFGVRRARLAFLFLTLSFHLGVSLTLFVGLFFIICSVAGLGLLPASTLSWLQTQALRLWAYWQQHAAKTRQFALHWPRLPWRLEQQPTGLGPATRVLLRGAREAVVGVLLLYVCWWNLDGIATTPSLLMSEPLRWLGYAFRVDQHWGMFAPTVFKDDGWYILEGSTPDGRLLDLNRGGQPASYGKPAAVVSLFSNDRWRKYSENYLFVSNEWMRPYYCNYLLRKWRENPANPPLSHLVVVYMKEVSLPDYQVAEPTREVLCECQ
ncbi:HTTM domain-containing protein [Hymenobacter cellulosivorans]|uniref:HTTM domain-containing protein n=1 Tax=Hymenobacter cellulosivorans TaxID=2932249 RepID=A0ABY4F2X0_9BACT|nr:HTTM domain-containing protein [Hymenobacter cellulosivorans]UOQ51008.1 HTTM domain-containing protein [Hymenobacter cellulosivorans]